MPAKRRPPPQPVSRSSLVGFGVAAILLVTAVAYVPAIGAPLLFDDTTAIDQNATITRLWPPSVALSPPAESPTAGRPIANYSLAVNFALNRVLGIDQSRDPAGPDKTISYHLLNLVLHLTSGLLIFGILRRTIRAGSFGDRWTRNADLTALVVAAVWLIHPLQTEAVNYLSQRTELLASWCYLATLYASIRAWDAAPAQRRRWYVAGLVTCLAGMGAKEIMVSAPLMVVLYDRAFRLKGWREIGGVALRGRRGFYGGLFASMLLLAALVASNARSTSAGFHTGMTSLAYLNSQGWAVPHYLALFVWPARLTLDYGYVTLPAWTGLPGLLLLGALGVATLLAWTRLDRWNWIAFSGAWFFCLMAPSSSIVPIATEIAAERRIYLALAAVIVVSIVGLDALVHRLRLAGRIRLPAWAIALVALAIVAGLTLLTFHRSTLYERPEAIWGDAVANRPGNARAWNNLGTVLAEFAIPREGEAESFYRHALDLDSTYVPALFNLATAAIAGHRPAEAEQLLNRVTKLKPDDEPALARLGGLLLLRGNAAGAVPYLEHAVELQPADAGALTTLGMAKASMGRTSEAASLFRRALQVDPAYDAAREALARLPSGGA